MLREQRATKMVLATLNDSAFTYGRIAAAHNVEVLQERRAIMERVTTSPIKNRNYRGVLNASLTNRSKLFAESSPVANARGIQLVSPIKVAIR